VRLVDILIATLVLFPCLTEGIWLEIPGAGSVELSDLGLPLLIAALVVLAVRERLWRAVAALAALVVLALLARYWVFEAPDIVADVLWNLTHGTGAVLVVAVAAAAVQRWSPEPWQRSLFARLGMKLAKAWLAALKGSPPRTLWIAAAAVGAFFLWVSLLRHWAFESHGYDLGIFTNAMWNLTHGNGYVSSVKGGINLFADHQSPLFWALAPFFWLFPRPEALLFAQSFGLAAGGPALFYLARRRFGAEHWAPAALPWLYWSYLPLRNANAFDFHPEVFMLPLFLWSFAAFASETRWARGLGLLALVAALGAKESAAVVAVGIGIAWALIGTEGARRGRWPGILLAGAGVVLFFFDVKVVPRIFGADYPYLGLYQRFGSGIADVLLAPFTQPGYFFSQVLNPARLNFLFWTLAPLAFLPLFDWRAALAALPAYLMLFLTAGDQRVLITFHYGIEPASALFWALPLGLAAFARRFGWKRTGLWMLFWALAALGPSEAGRVRSYSPSVHDRWLAAEVVPCLNAEAATAASDKLIPHLATRAWISYPDQLRQRPSGEPVRCVVTDLSEHNWPLGTHGVARVLAALPEQGYREAWKCRDVSIHELGAARCLRCVPNCR
jgi:uncharacterized membrane protein